MFNLRKLKRFAFDYYYKGNPLQDPRVKTPPKVVPESAPGQEYVPKPGEYKTTPFKSNKYPELMPKQGPEFTYNHSESNDIKNLSDEQLVDALRTSPESQGAKKELLSRYYDLIKSQVNPNVTTSENFSGLLQKVMHLVVNDFDKYDPNEKVRTVVGYDPETEQAQWGEKSMDFKDFVKALSDYYGGQVIPEGRTPVNEISKNLIDSARTGNGAAEAKIMESIDPLIRTTLVELGAGKDFWETFVHDPFAYQQSVTGQRPSYDNIINNIKMIVANSLKSYDPTILPFEEFVKETADKYIQYVKDAPELYDEKGAGVNMQPVLDYNTEGEPVNEPETDARVREVGNRLEGSDKAIWDFLNKDLFMSKDKVPGQRPGSNSKMVADFLNENKVPNDRGVGWTPQEVNNRVNKIIMPAAKEVFNFTPRSPKKYLPETTSPILKDSPDYKTLFMDPDNAPLTYNPEDKTTSPDISNKTIRIRPPYNRNLLQTLEDDNVKPIGGKPGEFLDFINDPKISDAFDQAGVAYNIVHNPKHVTRLPEPVVKEKKMFLPDIKKLRSLGEDDITSFLGYKFSDPKKNTQDYGFPEIGNALREIWKYRSGRVDGIPSFTEVANYLNDRKIPDPDQTGVWMPEQVEKLWHTQIIPAYNYVSNMIKRERPKELDQRIPKQLQDEISFEQGLENQYKTEQGIDEESEFPTEPEMIPRDIQVDIDRLDEALQQIMLGDEENLIGFNTMSPEASKLSLRKYASEQVEQVLSPVDRIIYSCHMQGWQPTQIADYLNKSDTSAPRGLNNGYDVHYVADRLAKFIKPPIEQSSPKGVIAKNLSLR